MTITLLYTHMGCALVSILLFIWRGVAMWVERPVTNILYRRVLPDSVDTVLLFSGLYMAFVLEYSLLESGWLAVKMIGLLAYIILGAEALKYGRSKLVKRSCFIAAITVFVFIIIAARNL